MTSLRRDHPKVAVARLSGMNELRRRSGRSKGRGNLLPDMAAFSHAGHDHAPLAGLHKLNGALEILRQAIEKRGL